MGARGQEGRARPAASRDSPRRRSLPPWAERFSDEARFLKSWLENPLATGAITPSGRMLARAMARTVDPRETGPVIELGPGTGPVTQALVERGVDPARLVLVEFDRDFCALLQRRFPRATVVQGDAYALAQTLRAVLSQPAAAIVSSLPLLTRPERDRVALLVQAMGLLAPGAPFVQFTYGLASPVPRQPWLRWQGSPPVWRNLPPARVWVYRMGTAGDGSLPPDLIDRLCDGLRGTRDKVRIELKHRTEKARIEWRERADRVRSHEKLQPTWALLRRLGGISDPKGPRTGRRAWPGSRPVPRPDERA